VRDEAVEEENGIVSDLGDNNLVDGLMGIEVGLERSHPSPPDNVEQAW